MKITEYTTYEEVEHISQIQVLDENQNIIEEVDFDDDGQQLSKVVNQYNEQKQLIKQTQLDENSDLIEDKEIVYLNGKENEIKSSFPDGSTSTERYVRGEGQIEIITEDEDGEFEGSVLHTLNEDGLTKELVRTNFMNKVDTRLQYEYSNGLVIKVTEQDAKGRFIKAYGFSYDENGNRICEDELNKKGKLLSRIVHKYENNKLISTLTGNSSTHFHYDGDILVKEEYNKPDGSTDVSLYEYQDHKKLAEKQYNIPDGNNIEDGFLVLSKRYIYE